MNLGTSGEICQVDKREKENTKTGHKEIYFERKETAECKRIYKAARELDAEHIVATERRQRCRGREQRE